ncbi:cupin domain-containing protein [Leisingera thetidis]|uniref:cupin domain-containing protein n=1 Tax=Leisingera thetidis TaxID=2930199 RepID=UPI0021F7C361|nr:cupin domain-containing protein [Leisingera thetidis]
MNTENIPVIRLTPDGNGAAFGPWQDAASGKSKERFLNLYDAPRELKGRTRAGIWEGSACVEEIDGYSADELMVVLEGSCVITDAAGHEEVFSEGDIFFMPMGFRGVWRQPGHMKKSFMMFLAD